MNTTGEKTVDPAVTTAILQCASLVEKELPTVFGALDELLKSPAFSLENRLPLIREQITGIFFEEFRQEADEGDYLPQVIQSMRLDDENAGPVARAIPKNGLLAENIESAMPMILAFSKLKAKLEEVANRILKDASTKEPFCRGDKMRAKIIRRLDGQFFKGFLGRAIYSLRPLQDVVRKTEESLAAYYEKRADITKEIYNGVGVSAESDSIAAIAHMDAALFLKVRSTLMGIHNAYKIAREMYGLLNLPQPLLTLPQAQPMQL